MTKISFELTSAKISPYAYPGIGSLSAHTKADVIKGVLDRYHNGVTFETANVKSRLRKVVVYRQHFMYLLNKYTNYSLDGIASELKIEGRKNYDHSTVIHSIRQWKNLSETDRLCRKIHKSVIEELNLLIK